MCLSTLRIIHGRRKGGPRADRYRWSYTATCGGVSRQLYSYYIYIRPYLFGPPCLASFQHCVRMVCSWMFLIRTNVGFFLGDEASKEGLEIDRALGGLTWIFGLGKHVCCFRNLKIWRFKVEKDMMMYICRLSEYTCISALSKGLPIKLYPKGWWIDTP